MSGLTLKEQLQALSLGMPPNASASAPDKNKKKPVKNMSEKKQKPTWLEHAQYGVELLRAYFPLCFKEVKETKPLKIGIKQDLVIALSTRDEIVLGDKACMVSSLAYYVGSIAYHKSMIAGEVRIDLQGNPAGIVTQEEAEHAVECRTTKLRKKNKSSSTAIKE